MEKLVAEQKKLVEEINRKLTNLKKDSRQRKTERYLEERRVKIQAIWDEVKDNDKKLEEQDPEKKHSYFRTEFRKEMSETYKQAIEYIEECRANIDDDISALMAHQISSIETLQKWIKQAWELGGKHEMIEAEIKDQYSKIRGRDDELARIPGERKNHRYFNEKMFEMITQQCLEVNERMDRQETKKIPERVSGNNLKLPTIQIPTFSGKYEEWPTFKDLFTTTIHNRESVSNVEKIQYLKSLVKGEAWQAIQHFETTEENYESAWEELEKRFNNKRLIINKLISKMFSISKANYESAQQLKNIYNTIKECMKSVELQRIDTASWDVIVVHLVTSKWDNRTNELYESTLTNPFEVQKLEDVLQFILRRSQMLESMSESSRGYTKRQFQTNQEYASKSKCKYCNFDHPIYICKEFKSLPYNEKINVVKNKKLCFKCLGQELGTRCQCKFSCKKCGRNHHYLIHRDESHLRSGNKFVTPNVETPRREQKSMKIVSHLVKQDNTVVLATAMIKVKNARDGFVYLRTLIDTGSQSAFITEQAATLLEHPREKIRAEIVGIGDGSPKTCHQKIRVQCKPRVTSTFELSTELLILPKLSSKMPEQQIECDKENWKNMIVADPNFDKPGDIDIILGAREYKEILLDGIKKTSSGLLGQNTELGWIILGTCAIQPNEKIKMVSMVAHTEEKDIQRFWEIEDVTLNRKLTKEEEECEQMYKTSTCRNADGRYIVGIPFQNNNVELGESRSRAMARLLQQEKRLRKNNKLESDYKQFMNEYIALGHMTKVPNEQHNKGKYYIPHQAVVREDSTTTKLRVVFDASCKTTNGLSLNDTMLTGPRIQMELLDIVLKWRLHKIVMKADIEKMYRQINIRQTDWDFQRILWRSTKSAPIDEYVLNTVTYGTAAAPYLAIRTMHQLADDEQQSYPLAARVVKEEFYVDDMLSGADSEKEAIILQQQLIELMSKGGFTLRKWSSNKTSIISRLPERLQDQNATELSEDQLKKSLGIYWAPAEDKFTFKVQLAAESKVTKRTILSTVAKLFDPLGWLSPIIIIAKLLIQELWIQKMSWDQEAAPEIKSKWNSFQQHLKVVEEIHIPRWMNCNKNSEVELHGFADASEKAYGAVVYSKVMNEDNQPIITLLAAKSKVAPIKTKITLPKLELCAAHLLGKLIDRVVRALKIKKVEIHAWTDSMIVLGWIKGDPARWKTFVSNRVVDIHQILPANSWSYVSTDDNPADAISRGVDPIKLKELKLWWQGPQWLHSKRYPKMSLSSCEQISEESKKCHLGAVRKNQDKVEGKENICERFSSLIHMTRVIAYCNRFKNATQQKKKIQGHLTVVELQQAENQMIKLEQSIIFATELKALKNNTPVDTKSKLSILHPFLDDDEIIRVGGRLHNSLLAYGEMHPIIITSKSHLATLIIREAHRVTLHGGNQETLAYIRRKYWIINAKNSVKNLINKCVICIRYKARTAEQLMGQLPKSRVTEAAAFTHTGVDYAGPIQVRVASGRGNKSYKGYLAIFVCLPTKAIHIEVVSEMSSKAFLAALKRFASRRGTSSHMYSDNGTTFVGANSILEKEVLKITQEAALQGQITNMGIQWHFIPPSAPHFGGLWEAGVKSVKHHLKRVIGESTLTYEELTTVTTQIEACLNSRPLCTLTSDINDFQVLTPAHFLIGREILSPPTVIIEDFEENLGNRWKLIQKMKTEFWRVWHKEYLHGLQQRYRWKTQKQNLTIGDVVIIKEDNMSPAKWSIGRITQVHPDKQGNTRVATIKKSGEATVDRPIHKLILLPVKNQSGEAQKSNINRNDETKDEQRTTRQPRVLWKIAMIAVLFLTVVSKSSATSLYHIEYPPSGFYIEHVSQSKIERGLFRIEIKFPKSKLETDTAQAQTIIDSLHQLCTRTKNTSPNGIDCQSLVHQLQDKARELSWIKSGLNITTQERRRRGVLGSLLTSIFGVNDEVYKDIEDLDKNQQDLIAASHHQTKFMLQALSKFNETEKRIYKKLNQFNSKLNESIDAINNMQHWYSILDHNKLDIHILGAYQVADGYLTELIKYYKSLLDMSVIQANIYEFISPAHVTEIITAASTKLPTNIEILPNNVLKTEVRYSHDYLHLYGYFAMAEVTEFMLIKITSIPYKVEDRAYWVLEVPEELVAIDYNTQRYFFISTEELKTRCLAITNKHICSPVVVRNIENSPNCVIDEIYQRVPKMKCQMIKKPIKTAIWKQLYKQNSWLFIMPQSNRVALTCNGQRNEVDLNITGIIAISQNCIITTKQVTLAPNYVKGDPIIGGFVRPVAVGANLTLSKPSNYPLITHQADVEPFEDMRHLQDQEQAIEDELHEHRWHTITHRSMYISLGTTCSIIGITLICAGIIYWIHSFKKRRQPNNRSDDDAGEIELTTLGRGKRRSPEVSMSPGARRTTFGDIEDQLLK